MFLQYFISYILSTNIYESLNIGIRGRFLFHREKRYV